MKISAIEFKRFMKDDSYWGTNFIDEYVVEITESSGESYTIRSDEDICDFDSLSNDSVIDIKYGVVLSDDALKHIDIKNFLKQWIEKQTNINFIVQAPKNKLKEIKDAVKKAGGRVI